MALDAECVKGRLSLLLLLPLLLAARPVAEPEWGPPLAVYRGMVASFGEYRGSHFHAGVDLSTGGRVGERVLAVADGEVFRVRHQKRGYGTSLYLRHAGGRISVYGHLDSVSEELGLARLIRERGGGFARYAGDIDLAAPVRVKRGQELGRSGETGEGLPHLHYELRDADNRPIDPVAAGVPLADLEAPILESVVFEPAGPGSAVNGGQAPVAVPLGTDAPPPTVRGRIRVLLKGRDTAGSDGILGLTTLEAAFDGRTVFRENLRRFSYEQTHLAGTVADPLESHLSPTVYSYYLYRHPGNTLDAVTLVEPVAEGAVDTGLLEAGEHRLEVIAGDASGNIARKSLTFVVEPPSSLPEPPPPGSRPVSREPGGTVAWEDLEVSFPPRALFEEGLISRDPGQAPDDPELPRVSRAWRLASSTYPFDKPATVTLTATRKYADARRLGVYSWDRFRKQWQCLASEPGTEPGRASATVRWLGEYALLEDTVAPVIGPSKAARPKQRGPVTITFPLDDRGMGVDEASLRVALDGKAIPAEFDPDRKRVAALLEGSPPAGSRKLRVEVRDRAGNVSRREAKVAVP